MNSSNKKRKIQSINDVMGNDLKQSSLNNNYSDTYMQVKPSILPSDSTNAFGVIRYAKAIYVCMLAICLITAGIAYYGDFHAEKQNYSYPTYIFTVNGVLTDIYTGKYDHVQSQENNTNFESEVEEKSNITENVNGTYSVDNSSVGVAGGAAMQLDDGNMELAFPEASSYDELFSQLESAMASNDIKFIGSKIGYSDGDKTNGYPESVVEIFASYMAGNSEKRNAFLNSIKKEESFLAKNGEAYIISLPIITFKVTTNYENTTFNFSGFSEQIINPGQQAMVSPLLPCMYQITAECSEWEKPIDGQIEATFGENLEVNFGTNSN